MSAAINGFESPKVRKERLARFGRRYAATAEVRNDHTGWDYEMQAIRKAALIAGPLSYQDIQSIRHAFLEE